jgi:hypothetical protein
VSVIRHLSRDNVRTTDEIEERLQRYAARYRGVLRRRCEASPRFTDLLFSFPAACIALITARSSLRRRAAAAGLVALGAPLADIAAALQLPIWLRRLPPEAFDRGLPARIGAAGDAEFGCRVISLLPDGQNDLNSWLHWVLAARAAGDDAFALWVARQPIFCGRWQPPPNALLLLAMFAWFSRHPELEAAKLMTSRWTPKMSLNRAAYLTRRWLHRALQDLCLALPAGRSAWAQTRQVGGFEFVPLLTFEELVQEGERMHNCLATYSIFVVHGICRLYSVRADGASVASMDVRNIEGTSTPGIAQLLGPGNSKASPEVHEAARAWLTLQLHEGGGAESFDWGLPSEAAFLKHVWLPYAAARKASTGEALRPPGVVSLLHDIGTLCRLEKH